MILHLYPVLCTEYLYASSLDHILDAWVWITSIAAQTRAPPDSYLSSYNIL